MTDERINARVGKLFEMLPGVRVAWLEPNPSLGCVRFGLAVEDSRTLSRLVHLARLINVPVHVELDWNCLSSSHDDPKCLRYDFRVPVRTDDDRLIVLADLLVEESERLALLRQSLAEPDVAAGGGT